MLWRCGISVGVCQKRGMSWRFGCTSFFWGSALEELSISLTKKLFTETKKKKCRPINKSHGVVKFFTTKALKIF